MHALWVRIRTLKDTNLPFGTFAHVWRGTWFLSLTLGPICSLNVIKPSSYSSTCTSSISRIIGSRSRVVNAVVDSFFDESGRWSRTRVAREPSQLSRMVSVLRTYTIALHISDSGYRLPKICTVEVQRREAGFSQQHNHSVFNKCSLHEREQHCQQQHPPIEIP